MADSVGMSNDTNDPNRPYLEPQATEDAPVAASETPPATQGPAPVVLVVEDDGFTRRAVGRKLQAAGYEVVLVPTAADALIVAQRMEFHVLVLDLTLPDVSFNGIHEGFAMLEWLHRQVGDFKFRIVVHTSQRSMQILQKADEHGVFAVCNKHRDFVNLLQSVAQAVESLKGNAA